MHSARGWRKFSRALMTEKGPIADHTGTGRGRLKETRKMHPNRLRFPLRHEDCAAENKCLTSAPRLTTLEHEIPSALPARDLYGSLARFLRRPWWRQRWR